ncbi:MAG: cytochrome c biogenesis CcdA family protein [Candidatus Limnocylindrales bacterium]
MGVEGLVAFAGGLLSLLSPCSALLLPAFFAYAFPSRGQLLLRTGVFYLGLVTLFIPLGLGLGAIGSIFLERRADLSIVAGILLIAIGSFQLAVGGFELPGAGRIGRRSLGPSGESLAATYTLGLVYGIGGFCSGPLLGGVLTIAGASGGALEGAVLLSIFAAGMAAPLLVLALLWERLGTATRGRLRGREVRIGPWTRHVSIVISSVLFIGLGVAFIVLQGGNALGGLYAALGAADTALSLETAVRRLSADAPLILASLIAAPFLLLLAVLRVSRRRRRAPGAKSS